MASRAKRTGDGSRTTGDHGGEENEDGSIKGGPYGRGDKDIKEEDILITQTLSPLDHKRKIN